MKRHDSAMQVQRSWLIGLVIVCWLSCAIAVIVCICGITVAVNQSSIQTDAKDATLQDLESRIHFLENQNLELRVAFEKAQARLYKLEQVFLRTSNRPAEDASGLPTSDLVNQVLRDVEDEGVVEGGNAKGDAGIFEEKYTATQLDIIQGHGPHDLQSRWLRSPRRLRSTGRPPRKECSRRCKGEKGEPGRVSYAGQKGDKGERGERGPTGPQGEKGDAGSVSYAGEKGERGEKGEAGPVSYAGQKGERGERGRTGPQGPPGECEHFTSTDAPAATSTDAPTANSTSTASLSTQYSAILAAHFEGDVDPSPAVFPRRDPINRGYVDLSEIDGGWIPFWRYAEWMDADTRAKFILHPRGNVTVIQGGIYYVYSQMLYHDPSMFMGHSLYIGGQKRFSCTECTVDRDCKFNTCYIGGVVQINSGEKIGIKVPYANRIIILNPDSTYFGLIRLS